METNLLRISSFISSIIVYFYDYLQVDIKIFKNALKLMDQDIKVLKIKLNNVNDLIMLDNRIIKTFCYVTEETKYVEKINYVCDIKNERMGVLLKELVYLNNRFLTFFRFICKNCNYIKISETFYKNILYNQNLIYDKISDKTNIYKFDFIICEKCGQLRVSMFNVCLLNANN
jgi:hypothetical protein